MLSPPSADPQSDSPDDDALGPLPCRFCDAAATALCPRCAAAHCDAHGGVLCDACSAPASGMPPAWLASAVAAARALGILGAILLRVQMPRLPGEEPPPAAIEPTVAAPAATVGLTGTPGAAPAAAASATAAAAAEQYAVRGGDTLAAIATRFGTTVDVIRAANPGINESALQIGQQVTIPANR